METLLNDPLLQSSLLPLTLSLLVAGVLGFSSVLGSRIAGAAIAISLLFTVIQIQGLAVPPRAAAQKLPYLIAAAGVVGLCVDALGIRDHIYKWCRLLLPIAMLAWLFGPRIASFDLTEWCYLVLIVAGSVTAWWQCDRGRDSIDAGLKLLLISGGLGAIILIGASAMLAQTTFALMAAIGGFLLLNWPTYRFPFAAAAQTTVVTALGALAAQSLFYTQASGIAILLLLPLLFIDRILPFVPVLRRAASPATRALSLGTIGAALLPLATGAAILLTDSSGMGY